MHVAVRVWLVACAACLVKLLARHVCVTITEAPRRAGWHPAHAAGLHGTLHGLHARPTAASVSCGGGRQHEDFRSAGWLWAAVLLLLMSGSQNTGRHVLPSSAVQHSSTAHPADHVRKLVAPC